MGEKFAYEPDQLTEETGSVGDDSMAKGPETSSLNNVDVGIAHCWTSAGTLSAKTDNDAFPDGGLAYGLTALFLTMNKVRIKVK